MTDLKSNNYSQLERKVAYDYFFNPNQTIAQLATKYSISIEKVNRITSKALKLKGADREEFLKQED